MDKILSSMMLAACLALGAPGVAQAQVGNLLDSRAEPVRSGAGLCVRTSAWSAATPLIGCDATPDRVVLLPAPDGKVGAVIVTSAAGEARLDTAYAGAEVGSGGVIARRTEDSASVATRYGGLLAARPPRPMSFTVHFATGSATELTADSQPVIEQLRRALANRPAPEITVIGHTDTVGAMEANDVLSTRRAEAVRNILVADGIQGASFEVAGRGEREMLVPTADEVAEPLNRRVEISVR